MITLEYLKESHVPALHKLANDPKVSATSGVPYPCEVETVKRWVEQNNGGERRVLTFVILVDNQVAGACILKKIDWDKLEAELAYWLGVQFWGKRIGTTAALMLRDFAFEFYNFKRMHSHFLKRHNENIRQNLGAAWIRAGPIKGRFAGRG